jgi:hypothetical protein
MMQMLKAGGLPLLCDESRRPDVDNPLGYFEYEPVKRIARDVSWLDAAVGRGVKIVLSLLTHLPRDYEYRLILMKRDLAEIMASQHTMLVRQGQAAGDEPSTSADEAFGGEEEGDEEHEEEALLQERFAAELSEIVRGLQGLPGVELLEVEHSELLTRPRRVADAVATFLGAELDVDAMAACVDPTLYRQRAPAPSEASRKA